MNKLPTTCLVALILSCNSAEPPAKTNVLEVQAVATPSASAAPSASAVPCPPGIEQEQCERTFKEMNEAAVLMEACSEEGPPYTGRPNCETISGHTTNYRYEGKKYVNRAHNIQLVAKKLNRTILSPGARLSFNEAVGERTEERGFKEAPIYFAGLKMQGMGGGTCQVSSTLYAAAMLAHLKIVQRTSHTRPSDYIKPGMDATVDYGVLDLIIENPYDFSIYLEATADGHWANEEEDGPGSPKKKVMGVWFFALKGKVSDFEVKHSWYGYKPLPFETRYIDSIYHRGAPKRKQRGKEGMPGRRLWVYLDENGKKIESIRVVSPYKPVHEIWMQNPNYEAPDAGPDAALTDASSDLTDAS